MSIVTIKKEDAQKILELSKEFNIKSFFVAYEYDISMFIRTPNENVVFYHQTYDSRDEATCFKTQLLFGEGCLEVPIVELETYLTTPNTKDNFYFNYDVKNKNVINIEANAKILCNKFINAENNKEHNHESSMLFKNFKEFYYGNKLNSKVDYILNCIQYCKENNHISNESAFDVADFNSHICWAEFIDNKSVFISRSPCNRFTKDAFYKIFIIEENDTNTKVTCRTASCEDEMYTNFKYKTVSFSTLKKNNFKNVNPDRTDEDVLFTFETSENPILKDADEKESQINAILEELTICYATTLYSEDVTTE
jgi:hypothetical protein